jgi:hypothetical protein
VLFGVKKWNDPTILNSLDVGDGNASTPYPLKVVTPSGPVWHRFTFDGYGEQANGNDWDLFFDNFHRQTRGRLWPLLTGERGEYELIAGRGAGSYLDTMANTANDGMMLPEQGVGRPAARGRELWQGHALGNSARVDAWRIHPAGLVDRCRPPDRAARDRCLPLPAGAVQPVTLRRSQRSANRAATASRRRRAIRPRARPRRDARP